MLLLGLPRISSTFRRSAEDSPVWIARVERHTDCWREGCSHRLWKAPDEDRSGFPDSVAV